MLLHIGEWMKVNGEAIYNTKTWRKYGEGPTQVVDGQFSDSIKKNFTSEDFRFTTAGGYLYATALKGPIASNLWANRMLPSRLISMGL